jgi:glycosyltransferase involved in cell wall biosynthesis
MACGCYVITTPNSGSVVQDGVNGALIPPGDVNALETSIRQAMQSREELERVGHRNANIIKSKYKQTDYGLALIKVYEHILNVTFEKSAG